MSEIIRFNEANSIRIVITDWTGSNASRLSNDKSFKLFKDYSQPHSDAYFHLYDKDDDTLRVQFDSSFDTTNVLKVKEYFSGTEAQTPTSLEIIDSGDYGVIESEIDISILTNGKYYLEITGTDSDGSTYTAKSEPFEVVSESCNTLKIEYYNNEPAFGMNYRTGITPSFRVPGRFNAPANFSETEPYTDSGGNRSKISATITKARQLELGNESNPNGVPDWLIEKLNIALDHDFCSINALEVSSENSLPYEFEGNALWDNPSAIIHLASSGLRNRHDNGVRDVLPQPPPTTPTNLTATVVSSSVIDLAWTRSTSPGVDFQIYEWSELADFSVITGTSGTGALTTSTSITGLTPNTTYYFRIKAGAGSQESGYSNVAAAKTLGLGLLKDSTNDYIRSSKTFNLGTDNFSVLVYLNPDFLGPNPSNPSIIFESEVSNGGYGISVSSVSNGNTSLIVRNANNSRKGQVTGTVLALNERSLLVLSKITSDATQWSIYKDGISVNTSSQDNSLISSDATQLKNETWGVRGTNSLYYGGKCGEVAIFQPELTVSQNAWIKDIDGSVKDLTTTQAKAQGIGISGVDTVGVGGITTLVVRQWRFDKVTEYGGIYYIREEITNDDLYAPLTNFADPANAIVDF